MKMHTKDKKKERLIILSTIIGMVIVLVVWGFQLHSLFTDTMAQEGEELSNEYVETIKDLESFQREVEEEFPRVADNFENIVKMIDEQNAVERSIQQDQEDQAIESVAREVAARLQEQAAQEVVQEENQEGEIIDPTSE